MTLDPANLIWLKGRVGAAGVRSVSELLDRLVSEARDARPGPSTSVVGTIDISAADPNLESEVRAEAERQLLQAALVDGILNNASSNARTTVMTLVQALGFVDVEVN